MTWIREPPPAFAQPLEFPARIAQRVAAEVLAPIQNLATGGADKNLDWLYAASPRLTLYSIGLRGSVALVGYG